jgi:hypothetical protein
MAILSNITFTWKRTATPEEIAHVTELLAELAGELQRIERFDFGPSLKLSPIARDYGVSILFEDERAFQAYLANDRHHEFAALANSLADDVAIVQIAPRPAPSRA